MWIDVGQLIREQVPNKNGNTLPSNLTSGSYEFRDLSHNGAGTLFEGKVLRPHPPASFITRSAFPKAALRRSVSRHRTCASAAPTMM
jgi:hypothetical protein